MPANSVTLALAQMPITLAAVERNFQTAANAVAEAARRGAEVVLLPELWACGYALDAFPACAAALDAGVFARMAALAQAYRVAVGGSHLERAPDGQLYNTFALYGADGQRWGAYRKIHRFLPMGEGVLAAGETVGMAATPWGAWGMAVCYDLRFPEVFRVQAAAGARVLLLVAEWPLSRIAHWETLLRARALENQAFVAAVNRTGASGDTVFGGRSMVVSPQGNVLAQAGEAETVLLVTLNLTEADAYRAAFPVLRHRAPRAYRLSEVAHESTGS